MGDFDGAVEGVAVGVWVGAAVGTLVGACVGALLGAMVGVEDGPAVIAPPPRSVESTMTRQSACQWPLRAMFCENETLKIVMFDFTLILLVLTGTD